MYSLTFIERDKVTLKLAHLTKQNGQEKSSVTAGKNSTWINQSQNETEDRKESSSDRQERNRIYFLWEIASEL